MTYLELTQKLATESGVVPNAGPPGTASAKPATISGATGLELKMCGWINDAWLDIQNERTDWNWLSREFSDTIDAGRTTYSPDDLSASRWASWIPWATVNGYRRSAMTAYIAADGVSTEQPVTPIPWETFLLTRLRGTPRVPARPSEYSIDQDGNLVFSPAPDQEYVVRGMYRRGPQALADSADEPEMPARHHSLIWQRAIILADVYDESDARLLALIASADKSLGVLVAGQVDRFYI